ncbi:ethylbenzene dehydrogenase-related protein [Hydrogenophaga sp.]|uniref:ethylbenzene dehydrogenase-related protein n=1 Tax=Hydrogenophaga sp. TaxID=1904254 RepID=UPI0027327F16|nr:ethylbenzene dehydrogenase-related protein [Hydrogenophaga sp.]MDP3886842.1 ethylbenzene dehydrogenase-related protein [Hydrogenophaga sp.]MDZ4357242.1 ethylbenzene dehydrogenase-related protein [Variovorax sp.]
MKKTTAQGGLLVAVALLGGALLLSWITHGTGVIRDDPKRNISVPRQLTVPLQVQAAYNGSDMFFRYRWPAEKPGIFHDLVMYEDGKWVTKGKAVAGSEPDGLHEDRVAMMLDDGSVPEFARYGGYLAIGPGIATFTKHAAGDEVKAHPYLGKKLKQEEVSKHLPQTRTDINDWASVLPEDTLKAQRAAGYFLDLWHWRGHRSNPINMSDDQVIAEARLGDEGKSSAASNWDGELKQPKLMFNAAATGYKALKWDDVASGKVSQDSTYFLRDGEAVPFDPAAGWQNGDTLPRRILRTPAESMADIAVQGKGRWADGHWDVTLTRKLDTGHPLDDKILKDQGAYAVAFAIHRNATGGRWHYVSLPATLGLGREANIVAQRFDGDVPAWKDQWTTVELFYPGQVSWPHLNGIQHAGARFIKQGQPVTTHHSVDQLKHYGIEAEFASEIYNQWRWTLFAGVALIAAFGVALNQLLKRNTGV